MGAIEDEYNRANGQGPTRNPGVPLRPSAPPPGTPPAPDPTATHPLRAAQPAGEPLGQTINGRAGPPAPSPVRTAIGAQPAPNLAETVAARAPQGPVLPPDQHPLRAAPPAGPTVGEQVTARAPQGPQLPPEQHPLRAPQPAAPALGETIAQRAAAATAQPAPQGAPAPQGNVMDKLRAAQLRYGNGEENTLKQTIAGRTPAGPYNGVPPTPGAATGAGAGAPPAGTPPGTPPGTAGQPGFGSRAGKAMADAARAAMPGGPAIVNGGTAAGKAIATVAKKSLPWVAPVVEGINVARVANDPEATKGDVVQQAVEGTGRWGSSVGGATLGGAAGALIGGPAAPVTAALGGIAGGIAGYVGGDAAISKLRSVFGLGDKSPIEKTAERADAARKAQAKLPAISEPVVQPPKAAPTAAPAPADVRTTANTPANTPTAQAAPQVSALAQQLAALQALQDASPIARTTIGGSGSHVFYKDGSMSPLLPGQPVPDDVAQFNNLHQRMNALRSGTPMPGDMPGATAPAGAAMRSAATQPGAQMHPNQQILHSEATSQGYDPLRAMMISSIETGGKFDAAAKNGKSSAYGLVQMTKANRDSYGLSPEQWADPAVQAKTGIDFMKKTDAHLSQQLGRPPTPAESYMGHLLGAAGASSVLKSDPNQKMIDVVRAYSPKNADAIVNNNGMKGMTVGQAIDKWGKLVDDHMARLGAAQPGAGVQVANGIVPQVDTGVSSAVHVIKGMQQSMAVPTETGYTEVPKTIFDAARRSPAGFADNGVLNNYLDGEAQNATFRANPVSADLAKTALQGQYQNQGQEIQGRYGVQQQGVSAAGHLAAAEVAANADHNKITVIGGGDAIDPVTKMPIKQPQQGVYMKDGVPTPVELPKAKPSEQEAHAQARAAIANKADKTAVNARLVASGYKPLPN